MLELPPVQAEAFQAAVNLYAEAADAGHPVGHFHVARLLLTGALGNVDAPRAHAHLAVAKEAGLARAGLRAFAWKE